MVLLTLSASRPRAAASLRCPAHPDRATERKQGMRRHWLVAVKHAAQTVLLLVIRSLLVRFRTDARTAHDFVNTA